jgi:hypothetical protein
VYNAVTFGINRHCSKLTTIKLFLPNWSNFQKVYDVLLGKHVNKGSIPYIIHSNQLWDHSSIKKDLCTAWLNRICITLAEGLLTGFKLELSKRVSKNGKLLFINSRWQKMIYVTAPNHGSNFALLLNKFQI